MLGFIKLLKAFLFPSVYVEFYHKYCPGDIVEWVDYSWEGNDWLVRITNFYRDCDGKIIYDIERLSDGKQYAEIPEDELILYATGTEMLEVENLMSFEED